MILETIQVDMQYILFILLLYYKNYIMNYISMPFDSKQFNPWLLKTNLIFYPNRPFLCFPPSVPSYIGMPFPNHLLSATILVVSFIFSIVCQNSKLSWLFHVFPSFWLFFVVSFIIFILLVFVCISRWRPSIERTQSKYAPNLTAFDRFFPFLGFFRDMGQILLIFWLYRIEILCKSIFFHAHDTIPFLDKRWAHSAHFVQSSRISIDSSL